VGLLQQSLLGAPEENGRAQHVGSDRARDDDSLRAQCGSFRRYFSWEGRFRAGAPSATNPRPAPSERGSRASPSRCGPVFVLERDPRNPQHPVLTRRRRSFAGKSWAKFSAQCVSPEKTKAHMCRRFRSSPGWTRTNNPPVNSQPALEQPGSIAWFHAPFGALRCAQVSSGRYQVRYQVRALLLSSGDCASVA
jgi:hypothetical protein